MPPSETFHLSIVNDHLFVDLGHGASVLVDTGSSISLGDVTAVTKPIDPTLLPPGLRNLLPQVSDNIGVQVTGILGRDWLLGRRFDLDLRHEGAFVFRRHGDDLQISDREALASLQLDLTLAGATHRAFIDTGAPIAYVLDLPDNLSPNPIRLRDFTLLSGSLESYEVAAYLIVALLSQFTPTPRSLRAARPPEAVRKAIQAIGCTAIVGLPLLRGNLTRWTPDKGLQIAPGGPISPHPAPRPHHAPRSPLHTPTALGIAGLLANTPEGKGDNDPTYTPIPLPESLQNFWQNVWKAANCEGRAVPLADGASMLIVPADSTQDWAIRCDLEVALIKDGPNSLLSALAKVHTDLGADAAQKARELLTRPGTPIRKLFQEIIDEGGQAALTCDRLDEQLVDADLLSTRPKADFPLGARLLIQRAFAFSTEFRENSHENIANLARACRALTSLLREVGLS